MIRIGIVGSENTHTAAIARTINVEKKIRGCEVVCVWGETAAYAKKAAADGCIPRLVKRPEEMLGLVDAVVVDHRHAKYHLPAALPFVKRGLPVFVDKPFCYRAAEGRRFLKTARRHGAAVTTFSVLPHQRSFARFMRRLPQLGDVAAGVMYGPCDLRSKWGGVFFYGIHQVDMALIAFGYDVSSVIVTKTANGSTGQLVYPSGRVVTMNLIKAGGPGFAIGAAGDKGIWHQPVSMDKNPYLSGIRVFTTMFKTGREPLGDEQMLKPVLVLEALERSVKSGAREKVGRV